MSTSDGIISRRSRIRCRTPTIWITAPPAASSRWLRYDRVRDRDALAVVSHGFWRRRLGGDGLVLSRQITINGRAFTIVGVAPEGFAGVHPRGSDTEIWIPTAMFSVGYRYCDGFARGCTVVELLGRLRPDVTAQEAESELAVMAKGLAEAYPLTNRGTSVHLVPARGLGFGVLSDERRQLQLFAAVTAVVLLIACANIAGPLLARASGRRKEIAMRLALGAGRWRITRQLLTECFVLAALAGGLGLVVASWGNALLEALLARDCAGRPVSFALPLSPSIIAATAAVSTFAALIFGLIPSIMASRDDVIAVLKDETASGGARRSRLRPLLVAGQIAMSVVLLVSAALLLQSVRYLLRGPGFDPSPLVMLRLRPSLIDYSRDRAHSYQRQVISRLESLPGVVHATPSVYLPFGGGQRLWVTNEHDRFDAIAGHEGARYFGTIAVLLLEGRDFPNATTAARHMWRSSTTCSRVGCGRSRPPSASRSCSTACRTP
jgi:predicted permease